MPVEKQELSKGPFIPTELRPPVGPDLGKYPPLGPGAPRGKIQKRVGEVMNGEQRTLLGQINEKFPPEMWKMAVTRNLDVHWTVLDGEAVLLNLQNGAYYTLNRVGRAIWELFTGDRPLERILSALCELFDVTEDVAREDLVALVARLRQEGLIN